MRRVEFLCAIKVAHRLEHCAYSRPPPRRTLQYRVKSLVDSGRLVTEGDGRWARYRLPEIQEAVGRTAGTARAAAKGETVLPLSDPGAEIQSHVRRPPERRKPALPPDASANRIDCVRIVTAMDRGSDRRSITG